MNKTYKYTLTAHEKKEISFDTGVARLAIANGDGVDGSTTVVMSEITKQHSGDLVSFIDGADAPFADFIVNIVAQQSGSGDPSPTNVRPISGWTGATINVSGEDTSNPTTYNIDWESVAGTVYGGSLNVKTGELTVTHVCIRITTISSVGETGQSATLYLSPLAYSHNISENDLKCNCLKSSNYSPNYNNHVHFANTSICALYFADVIGTTKREWETYLDEHPLYICYKIATPVTYQLTPVEVRSLLGLNNVWADCGPVNVRYFVQSTQPMIDYIDDKTPVFFDAAEDLATYDVSLVGATSTDIKNYLLANKNANIVIRVKRYSTILLYYLREYSPNYFAEFATHAVIFDAEGTKSMRIDYLRLDLTQETSDFTDDYIILPTT